MVALLQIAGAAASVCHKTIAAAQYHTCVILENGTVKCWGLNHYGQLGYGDQNDRGDAINGNHSPPTLKG
ncbi:hypothetical protein T484DRAFT_1836954 [Baffinella frigidus]|nr:hypothetical protein T484DRAFT_1836954 [Cryptophyta sp. CCMP2293]